MNKQVDWQPGQQFQARDGALWEIEKGAAVLTSIPHVILIGVKDRKARKVLAAEILSDRKQFAPV